MKPMKVRKVYPSRQRKAHYAVQIGVTGKSYFLCKGLPTFGTHKTEVPLDKNGNPKEREMCKLCANMAEKHKYVEIID